MPSAFWFDPENSLPRDAPLGRELAAGRLNHVDAFTDGKNAAQRIDERAETLQHHIGVSEEAARAYDDGWGFDVDYLAFLLALNARACAIFHDERFARGVEHELSAIAFGPLLQRTHAVHAFLLGLGVFRVGLEVAANGSVACAVIVGAKTRWDAEFFGELVDGGARKLDSPFDGCGIRGPVSVFHDVVKGLFDAEVDARHPAGASIRP